MQCSVSSHSGKVIKFIQPAAPVSRLVNNSLNRCIHLCSNSQGHWACMDLLRWQLLFTRETLKNCWYRRDADLDAVMRMPSRRSTSTTPSHDHTIRGVGRPRRDRHLSSRRCPTCFFCSSSGTNRTVATRPAARPHTSTSPVTTLSWYTSYVSH